MPVIVFSSLDPAGCGIAQRLVENHGFAASERIGEMETWEKDGVKLARIGSRLVEAEFLDAAFSTDLFVFASRHRSESKQPTLCVHACGNWAAAALGGNAHELALAAPLQMRSALLSLAQNVPDGFDATLEATHHGPTSLKTPLLFAEIGSGESEWKRGDAADAVAIAIMEAMNARRADVAIGIGGPHYAPNFTKRELAGEVALSHICPKHFADSLDDALLRQMIAKSGGADKALIDWKSLKSQQRERVISLLDGASFAWERV
jgi:D-aminoacyl-tRNA deacylase